MKALSAGIVTILLGVSLTAGAADIVFLKQNSEPKYLPDERGLCDQIYQEIERRLADKSIVVAVDPAFYPVKRMLKMLDVGQGHVFCGAGVTEERKQTYGYSQRPVYDVSNVIMAHRDETEIPTSFQEIADKELIIGSFYGTSSSAWLKQQPGVLVSDSYISLSNVIDMIAHEKGLRYFFYHDLGLNYYVRTSGEPLKVLPTKFRTIPQKLLYSPELSAELRSAVEQALEDMANDGALAAIQASFFEPN